MATYSTANDLGGTQQNLSASYKSVLSILAGSTARRGYVEDIIFGADGTPADNALVFTVMRQTADDGTKTNVTPLAVDPADPAFTGLSRVNYTVEPTITASSNLLSLEINQRATFEWACAPGSELVIPATANAGVAIRAKSPAYTLSGGERRRAEITRALVISPRFILLDEPFAGIDPIAVADIQKIIFHLKSRGIGVLITDHNVRETLRITDRAYIVHDGVIFRSGTPGSLAADEEVRGIYLGDAFRLD